MSLTDLEKEILAEGKKVEAAIRRDVLEIKRSKLVAELEAIEDELAKLLAPVVKAVESAPAEKPAADEPKPKTRPRAKPKANDAEDAA